MESEPTPPSPPVPAPSAVAAALDAALGATLAATPDAAIAYDDAGRIVAANERACTLLGYPHAALLGLAFAEVLPPAGAGNDWSELGPGEARRVEGVLRRRDGSAVHAGLHAARLALAGPPLYVCTLLGSGEPRAAAQQRREQALALFCDHNPAACFQKDADGRYQLANASCAAILGMDPVACIGKTDYELFSRDAAEAFRARDRQVFESGEVAVATVGVPTAAGVRSVLLHKFPIRDAGGRIVSVAAIASDVTAQRAVEDRLRIREQQLAAFFENSPTACFQKDLHGRYELVNAACARQNGLDPAGCIGKTDHELFPAAMADVFRASDREALASGTAHVCEQALPSAAGTRHFLVHKFPIRDAAGTIASLAGSVVEITELKRAEERLRDAESRLRAIVQGMPVLLDAFDDQARIVAWNSECERVTGYSAAEIIGNPHALEMLYPDPAVLAAMMAEAAEHRHEEYSRIYDLTAKDGGQRSIEWFNVGARLPIPGWLEWSVGIDVTERRRLEAALHEATVTEQRRLGHDLHDGLGQELTGLSLLASSLARRFGATNPELHDELEALAEIAVRAIVTCKSIARGLAPVDEPTHGLADALRRLTTGFPHPDGDPVVTFSEDASAQAQISLEACNHLYRIAQEALANAVRHSGARMVRIHLHTDRSRLRLRISDDGRGIGARPAASTGMGLRTMQHRANAIGARLAITAAEHGGTVVTCECPNRAARTRRLA